MEKSNLRLSDGLIRQNIVLMSGIAIAPVAARANTFENGLALAFAFTLVAFFSIFICRLIPKKIVYTIRVIIYALIAGVVLIPVHLLVTLVFGEAMTAGLGLYLPILAVNPLILTKTETRFCLRPIHIMMVELLGYIAGFNVVCILVGLLRDIFVNGRIGWMTVDLGFHIPAIETTFGGLIVVGVMAGLFRALYNRSKQIKAKKLEKERRRQELIREVAQ
ncbi:MAG: NADH:ubiquinone oxidoreductase subunit RnfE [Oscillospiraceae bacterium]|nr:NADH:ubiquinone oxidoreductase subunit RnfE [Oscillospiraceae bacterium]